MELLVGHKLIRAKLFLVCVVLIAEVAGSLLLLMCSNLLIHLCSNHFVVKCLNVLRKWVLLAVCEQCMGLNP